MIPFGTSEALQGLPTPFYLYDVDLLRRTLLNVSTLTKSLGFTVHYAVKANANERILREVASFGFGADCVSGNEIKAALEAGFPAKEIVFAGVGKSDKEISYALQKNIFCLHCESVEELKVINQIAASQGKRALVALRVNPNISAETHLHITTGTLSSKFGLSPMELNEAIDLLPALNNVRLIGLHLHIGSQITKMEIFQHVAEKINQLQENYFKNSFLPYLNVGGGLGVSYENPEGNEMPDFEGYFNTFSKTLRLLPGQKVHFELGRSIVAQCGSLVTKVLYVKGSEQKKFAVVDAGMTDLMRPALYNAVHKIVNLSSYNSTQVYDVVGPVCESTDCFAHDVALPKASRGDLLTILSAGAYGEVMSSRYNLREKPQVIFSDEIKVTPIMAWTM
ncbi:MAG TPA: diaminopimelate decarboxylase [Williamwhitmania sp.]|nr:diaminopimelate decarboxylase [Williamwhitmania sp.]